MDKNLEKLIEQILYLTINLGQNHPESLIPEDIIIAEDGIYNCSYLILVLDLGKKVYGVGDVRLQTTMDHETVHIKCYTGRKWSLPDKLVLEYLNRDEMKPELTIERGDWEKIIQQEYELTRRIKSSENAERKIASSAALSISFSKSDL